MKVETKYDLKQCVYLVHDPEQQQRMITEISVVTPKFIRYQLSCGSDHSDHYEYEISPERNEALSILKKQPE
jgi:hypothetical protein